MSKDGKILMGVLLIVLSYVSVCILGLLALKGVLGIVGIPLVVTLALALLIVGAFFLIKSGIVCRTIRVLIYFMSGLAVVCVPIMWAFALGT